MNPFTALTVLSTAHLTDQLLIGSNFLIIAATIALAYYTAKVANETAQQIHRDDNRVIRALIRNRKARHAKRRARQEKSADVRRISS